MPPTPVSASNNLPSQSACVRKARCWLLYRAPTYCCQIEIRTILNPHDTTSRQGRSLRSRGKHRTDYMMVTVDLFVKNDYSTYPHPEWQDFQAAVDALERAGFRAVPSSGAVAPPEVIVQIRMSAGGYVPNAPLPEIHAQQYYLPGANLAETKTALADLVTRPPDHWCYPDIPHSETNLRWIFNRAILIPGLDPTEQRRDACGNTIRFSAYGDTNSAEGWEVDHIKPVATGGMDVFNNLRPLQWKANRERGALLSRGENVDRP